MMLQNDSGAKGIVFSQFTSMLDLIGFALHKVNIWIRYLQTFYSCRKVQVLLVNLKTDECRPLCGTGKGWPCTLLIVIRCLFDFLWPNQQSSTTICISLHFSGMMVHVVNLFVHTLPKRVGWWINTGRNKDCGIRWTNTHENSREGDWHLQQRCWSKGMFPYPSIIFEIEFSIYIYTQIVV